jgi:hypothetical protein
MTDRVSREAMPVRALSAARRTTGLSWRSLTRWTASSGREKSTKSRTFWSRVASHRDLSSRQRARSPLEDDLERLEAHARASR